jgi:replication-associated recombination protein RarA
MTDDTGDDGVDYKVGYRKPPVHSRFGPGNRANPRGRPKGSPNLSSVLKRAAREKVVVTERGRRRKITKIEAAAKQLLTQAASGDARAIQLAIELLDRLERRDSAQPQATDTASRAQSDAEILKALKSRLTGATDKEDDNDRI